MSSGMLLTFLILLTWAWGGPAASLLHCNFDNIWTMPNLDMHRSRGRWYVAYSDHIPSDMGDTGLSYYDLAPAGNFMNTTYTRIKKDETCEKLSAKYERDPEDGAVFSGVLPGGVTNNVYVIASDDDTTSAFVVEYMINGTRLEDPTTVVLAVRNPGADPDMNVLAEALQLVCGPDANALCFFERLISPNSSVYVTEDLCGV